MITPEFVHEMLLAFTPASIDAAVGRMTETLWPYAAVALRRKSVVNDGHVPLADPFNQTDNVVEIIAVLYNQTFIPRATELRLDALEPRWRISPSGIPNSYLFAGETQPGYIRLYPPPSQVVDVVILALVQPGINNLVSWSRMLVALKTIGFLASSDPVRARVNLAEFMKPFVAMIESELNNGL